MAGRLLQSIGATLGITETFEAYVDTAVTLATRPDWLTQYRSLFTEANWAATLGDIASFTHHYEQALIDIELARRTQEPEPGADFSREPLLVEAAD
jgi:hypothetical protein